MHFAEPFWLLAGTAACLALLWQYRRFDAAQRIALEQFAAARLHDRLVSSVSVNRRRIKRTLFALGVGFAFVALARPQAGYEWQETHRKGLEIVFAMDTSKSMLAQDVKPDRLTRAKMGVTDLVGRLNGDGVGLIAFAGSAFLQCPVTLDYDAFRESLDALDVNTIPRGGTDIAAAIHEAEAVFKNRASTEKIMVLVTDGEDLGGEALAVAQEAGKEGVRIFTVGVGGTHGELVPVPDENGTSGFARDANGQFVKSRLDEAMLKKIAEATGGMYEPLGSQGEGLTKIYEQGLAAFTRKDLSSRQQKVPLEQFHWAVLAALFCLVCEMLIGTRRLRSTIPEPSAPARARHFHARRRMAATTALMLLGGVASTQAASPQLAEQAYQKGEFAKSQQEYASAAAKEPANASLHFNTGAAAYKAGDYAQAAGEFQGSLKTDRVPLQQSAYYNLGNAQFQIGQKTAQAKPEETIKTWEQAVKSYNAALQIKSDDSDARYNRDLVLRKIDQLKKQQEQKKQEQRQKDQKDQQKPQDQKNDPKNQQKDSQNQSGQGQGKDKDTQNSKPGQSNDSKDPNAGGQNQKPNSKDQKAQDQKKDRDQKHPQQTGASDKENQPKDQTMNSAQNEPKEDKGQKDEQGKAQAQNTPKPGDQTKQPEAKSGQTDQPKPVNAEKKPGQGEVQAAQANSQGEKSPSQQAVSAADDQKAPGEMSRNEARQLLDSLKGEERRAPSISQSGRAAEQPNNHKILKDW
jgi:Ca-activated chloride channel family protein